MAMRRGTVTGNIKDRSVDKVLRKVRNCAGEKIFQVPQLYGGRYRPEDYADMVRWAANGASAVGCVLREVSLELLLAPGEKESRLKKILAEIGEVCAGKKIAVGAVRAETNMSVNRTVCVVTGYGEECETSRFRDVAAGQQIVMSKWIAAQGTAWLAECFAEQIRERLPRAIWEEAADFRRDIDSTLEAETAMRFGVSAMWALGEGGVLRGLREFGDALGMGLSADLEKIPMRQETIELTELFGMNPYELSSFGSLLMLTDDGAGLVEALAQAGVPSAVIGGVADGQDKVVCHGEEIRYLDTGVEDSWHSLSQRTSLAQ